MKVGADALMLEPARFSLRILAAQGLPVGNTVFGYVATSMRSQWPGAPHATEISYVFATAKAKGLMAWAVSASSHGNPPDRTLWHSSGYVRS
jgi:carboxylesterase type B